MRLGIWCDYGFTLEPSEGIGVFVDNLVRGIDASDRNIQMMLVAHPGQESRLQATVASTQGRVRVTSCDRMSRFSKYFAKRLRKKSYFGDELHPPKAIQIISGKLTTWLESSYRTSARKIIESCDVWLLPYVGLDQSFHVPHVVVVHDLVPYHFDDILRPKQLRVLKRQVRERTSQATLVACMSNFIAKHDIQGAANVIASKIRVIENAVPQDLAFPQSDKTETLPEPLQNGQPYLFYPAAFRTYKNHRLLIELLPRLREIGLERTKLVFTGIRDMPAWLRPTLASISNPEDVVVLGKVSRAQLQQLYRSAFATIVPSLYEQGSFPIVEALSQQCPALCSDIPALREQFHSMGDGMLYFDPNSVDSLLKKLGQLAENRSLWVAKQSEAFRLLRNRNWTAAASDWLTILKEAVQIHTHRARAA